MLSRTVITRKSFISLKWFGILTMYFPLFLLKQINTDITGHMKGRLRQRDSTCDEWNPKNCSRKLRLSCCHNVEQNQNYVYISSSALGNSSSHALSVIQSVGISFIQSVSQAVSRSNKQTKSRLKWSSINQSECLKIVWIL